MPALEHASSFSPPGAPDTPTAPMISSPALIGKGPCAAMIPVLWAMAPSHPTAAHLRGCGLKQTAAARRAGYSNRGHADAVVVGHRLAARILRAAWPIAEELRKLAWPTEARGCGGRRCPLGQASAAET